MKLLLKTKCGEMKLRIEIEAQLKITLTKCTYLFWILDNAHTSQALNFIPIPTPKTYNEVL